VLVWLCTPPTAQSTSTAPSSTRRARSTSIVKSTCPGVSMMLISCSFHRVKVAADWIVMPFSRSRSMLSILAPTPSLPRTYRPRERMHKSGGVGSGHTPSCTEDGRLVQRVRTS